MLFYESYSHEIACPQDPICTIARHMAQLYFVKEHPHLKRNANLCDNKSWKMNFKQNWHIHASIFEQALRKVVALKKTDISVEDTDLAFCIFKYRTLFEKVLEKFLIEQESDKKVHPDISSILQDTTT